MLESPKLKALVGCEICRSGWQRVTGSRYELLRLWDLCGMYQTLKVGQPLNRNRTILAISLSHEVYHAVLVHYQQCQNALGMYCIRCARYNGISPVHEDVHCHRHDDVIPAWNLAQLIICRVMSVVIVLLSWQHTADAAEIPIF